MKIYTTVTTEHYIGKIYTNYSIAYTGNHFGKSFLKFNSLFISDVSNAVRTNSRRYKGMTCILGINYVNLPSIGDVAVITQCKFDPIILTRLMFQINAERIMAGISSTPPALISITKRVSDYSYFSKGGFYYGHEIDIVKKKGSSKTKPQFNYYDRNTRSIMFNFDFYSPFEFVNNEAEAWATDGHKYKLPSMIFLEAKNKDGLHSKTKRLIRLT